MAKLHPFKAIRPTRDKVHLVATRPYYAYKKSVLKAKMESNPYTFLRIINPEFDLPKEKRLTSDLNTRFKLVKSKYEEFIGKGILIQDSEPHLYLYRQSTPEFSYTGIIGGASVHEYFSDHIKKHEATLTAREEMFIDYLDIITCNAEPVLLCHEPNQDLKAIYRSITEDRPEYEFTTTDCITHEVWVVNSDLTQKIQASFEDIPNLYIADGHHRSASSAGLYQRRKEKGNSFPNDAFFLAFILDETELKIFEYNRLVRLKSGITLSSFFEKIESKFNCTELDSIQVPQRQSELVIVSKNRCLLLKLSDEKISEDDVVDCLDAAKLTEQILKPYLDISDLKTDNHIEFFPGIEPLEELREKMDKKGMDLAFLLHPVDISQVKKVADAGKIMPPKSTWVEPKMRSGLTIYNLNE